MVESNSKIIKQMEYYLGDVNLARDKFFRERIAENKEGYIDMKHFLNCNNIKAMKVSSEEIAEACKESILIEFSEDKHMVRRIGNKTLPEKAANKRDSKAKDKEQHRDEAGEDEVDEKGRIILTTQDFEDPIIVHYLAEVQKDEEFKVAWKDVENAVREQTPRLKLIYSRADKHEGDLAFSKFRLKEDVLDDFLKTTVLVSGRKYTFTRTTGEALKEFWQKEGGHYQFCIQPKIRAVKKQMKMKSVAKKESVKRMKTSYEIAGIYYNDINKVKSKSRAILNLKKDGEKLAGND